jgi:hypothetical protein
MKQLKEDYVRDFLTVVKDRNFITFDELEEKVGISACEALELKNEFEKQLRLEDSKIRITSRTDLEKPGFEIES